MSKNKKKSFIKDSNIVINFFFNKFSSFLYIFRWTIISLIIASFIGTSSALFLITLNWATNFRESHEWLVYFLPIAGFVVGSIYYYGKNAEAGNNLLIDTIHEPTKEKIPLKMAPLVYMGTIVTHFFGGSAGREGTALQMAGSIADQFSELLRLKSSDRSILIIAAVAAGFGSVFGTPLAGTIFGLEFYFIGKIRYNAIFPALISAVIADYVCKLWGAHHTLYYINATIPSLSFLIIFYAIIAGIFFGLCAIVFSRGLSKTSRIFKRTINYPPLRPFVGGAIVVICVLLLGTTKYIGLGIPTIVDSFQEQLPVYDFVLKIIFTVVTLAAGFKGGEVTPLFFIGATLGNALGYFIPLPLSLLAGMGFVAVFSGATNTPIACSIMAIELFGTECGIFVFISCVVAYLVSGHTSIYGSQVIGESKNKKFILDEGKRVNEL